MSDGLDQFARQQSRELHTLSYTLLWFVLCFQRQKTKTCYDTTLCFFPVNSRMSQYLRDMQDQLTILSQKLNGERLAEKRKVFPQKCMKSGFKSLRHSRTIISGRPWIFMMEQKRKVNQLHWHELCMGVGLPEKYLNLHVTNVYHRHNYFIWLSLLLSCLSLLCFCALVVWCYMITLTTNVVTSSVNWTQYKGHFINHR